MENLKSMAESGMSSYEIANTLGVPRSTVSSRLASLGISTKHKSFKDNKTGYLCSVCGDSDSINFYGHKKSVCKKCFNKQSKDKYIENKKKAVQLLGGSCSICGYNKCLSALEFHHTNPEEKDKNFKTFRHWSWNRIEKELEGCVLLCANCHREEHETLREVKTDS